jgi:toxin CcdB
MESFLMARFDVYTNAGPLSQTIPFLLDVQSDLLNGLDTRVVVPLRKIEEFPQVKLPKQLTPVLSIDQQSFVMETPKMASVPQRILKDLVTSLSADQSTIVGALDFLLNGY